MRFNPNDPNVNLTQTIARFEQLQESGNQAYMAGKDVEDSWEETFGDEYEKILTYLISKYRQLDHEYAQIKDWVEKYNMSHIVEQTEN